MSRYDIIVILEVVDVTGDSVRVLLEELNRRVCLFNPRMKQRTVTLHFTFSHFHCPAYLRVNTIHHYALQLSPRLGRKRYKEQFLFLYRYG